MKNCFKCGEIKPLSEFYRHSKMADGYVGKCKECTKKDVAANRANRDFYYKEYDRNRGQDPKRKEAVKVRSSRYDRKAYIGAERVNRPQAYRARNALNNALRNGQVSKPVACEACGSAGEIHGHHHDYSKPLDVRWLCPACHGSVHRALNAERRAEKAEAFIVASFASFGSMLLRRNLSVTV